LPEDFTTPLNLDLEQDEAHFVEDAAAPLEQEEAHVEDADVPLEQDEVHLERLLFLNWRLMAKKMLRLISPRP